MVVNRTTNSKNSLFFPVLPLHIACYFYALEILNQEPSITKGSIFFFFTFISWKMRCKIRKMNTPKWNLQCIVQSEYFTAGEAG